MKDDMTTILIIMAALEYSKQNRTEIDFAIEEVVALRAVVARKIKEYNELLSHLHGEN